MRDEIVERVVDKMYERSQIGITKYGTTLYNNNKDNYMLHLQEELMDAALYLEKLMSLEKEITRLVRKHPHDATLGEEIRRLVS
jgi:hypothetical protein